MEKARVLLFRAILGGGVVLLGAAPVSAQAWLPPKGEAAVTLGLGPRHVDPRDIELATHVDAFDFAMEARRTATGLQLTAEHG